MNSKWSTKFLDPHILIKCEDKFIVEVFNNLVVIYKYYMREKIVLPPLEEGKIVIYTYNIK